MNANFIQDFEFPEASLKIKATADGQYIAATGIQKFEPISGVYKPQMRVFDLSQMTMKFDRHMDCENVTFEVFKKY